MKDLPKKIGKKLPLKTLSSFESKFQKQYPKAHRLFSILRDGSSRFGKETLLYLKLKKNTQDPKFVESMKWNEINIVRETPRDWKAVAPVMIIASFPFLNYIILPLAYFYPQKLLCRQFWTQKQKLQFGEARYNKKILLHDTILNDLKKQIDTKLSSKDNVAKNFSLDLIEKVQSGKRVDFNQVTELKPILYKPDFNLNCLTENHLQNLVDFHSCGRVFNWSKLKNLEHYAYWLSQEDRQLSKIDLNDIEGEFIYNFCYERGINPNKISEKEIFEFLSIWFNFSSQMKLTSTKSYMENNYTLYLHGKILLGKTYNTKSSK